MTEQSPGWQAPERLREDAELGPLLERGNREFASGLDEASAFQRLAERIERQSESKRWHRVSLGAALSFGAAIAVAWGVFRESPGEGVAIGPELTTPSPLARSERGGEAAPTLDGEVAAPEEQEEARAARATEPARLAKARELGAARLPEVPAEASAPGSRERRGARELAPAEPTLEPSVAEPTLVPARPAQRERNERQPDPEATEREAPKARAPKAEAPPSSARELSSGRSNPSARPPGLRQSTAAARSSCLDIAGRDTRAAEQCFAERATGSGLSAEMALYEMARLRRDMLRDALGALDALNDYRQRFPRGSLRHEVDISRIELLSQLGRSREALRESEALLFSPTGRERAAELHVLRGNVFRRDLSDWAAAAREYSLAEPFGGALGVEASRLRGQSLEAMGDLPGALAAYRRYLQAAPPSTRRAEVAGRVELLSTKVSGGK